MHERQGVAEVNGAHLHYHSAGQGDAVVLVHGFSLDLRMWDDQVAPLAQAYQVIRYDLRGFGQSSLPISGQPYLHHEDLAALLDHLGIPAAHLVGLSKGGAVALDFTLAEPGRVRSLTLIDAPLYGHPWSREATAQEEAVWQRGRAQGIPAAKTAWLAHPLFAPALTHPATAAALRWIIADYSGWHFVNSDPDPGLQPPAAQRLHEIHAPTLVMVGELDMPDFRTMAAVIARQVQHGRLLTLPGAGHMANMETPAQVTAAILRFLHAPDAAG